MRLVVPIALALFFTACDRESTVTPDPSLAIVRAVLDTLEPDLTFFTTTGRVIYDVDTLTKQISGVRQRARFNRKLDSIAKMVTPRFRRGLLSEYKHACPTGKAASCQLVDKRVDAMVKLYPFQITDTTAEVPFHSLGNGRGVMGIWKRSGRIFLAMKNGKWTVTKIESTMT